MRFCPASFVYVKKYTYIYTYVYSIYIYTRVLYLSLVPQSSASSPQSTIPKLFKLITKLVAKVHPPTTKEKHQTHGMPNFLLSPDTCCKWTESEINLYHLVLAQLKYVEQSDLCFGFLHGCEIIFLNCPRLSFRWRGAGVKRTISSKIQMPMLKISLWGCKPVMLVVTMRFLYLFSYEYLQYLVDVGRDITLR